MDGNAFNPHNIYANFIATIESINFWDVIDFLLLVAMFFVVIRLMRETRATQLFKGIMLLLVVLLIMAISPLKVTSFLFQNLIQVGLLAVVIVFQPELRRMLEKIGNAKVMKVKQMPEQRRERTIQGIADACEQLSRTKTSAIILIEQKVSLDGWIEKSTVINADPDTQLFCNLFYFKAPMHNTAVIVSNDKIYAAGCILKGTNSDSDEEARFEAVKNIVDSTDALAIISSEKTGQLAFLKKGQYTEMIYDPKEKIKLNLRSGMSIGEDEAEDKNLNFLDTVAAREDAIRGISDACERLSRTRTGALIVIERQTKLGDIIEQSTVIDAKPDPDFICNLFYNKAPLHDGAVIIRGNRVYAAGCFLPMTAKGQYMDVDLGSRHRAAVGMTENSDALVIVVSEETGIISVAESGQLTRSINQQDPKKWLTHILQDRMPAAAKKGLFGRKFRSGAKNGD
ncbi:MAG: diadenylate cyclase [Oscillospiraceae bacterium]|nr:diadenylate cyclase [Oscillospiraceae bacterium]